MFGKLLSTRTPATTSSPAPQFQLGPSSQSVSKKPSSLVKKLLSVKNVFRSPSSSNKGTSHRYQGIPTLSRPSQGRPAVAQNDWTGRDYPHSTVESTRSPELLNVPPHFQVGRPSPTSARAPHASSSANNSQPLAPPRFVATIPATSRAPIHSTSQCSTRSAASRSIVSSKTSSPVALPQAVATTPATTYLPTCDCSSFHPSTTSAARRSASSINPSPLRAPHQSAALPPATTFTPAGSAPRRSTRSAARHLKCPDNASLLLAIPQSIATTPATAASPVFSSIRCPKPTRNLLHAREIIANLEKIAAATDIQYSNCAPTVYSAIPDEVVPCTKSVVDESGSAKRRLENLKRRIVAVEDDCSQLEEQLHEECEKVDEPQVALKKAGRNLKGRIGSAPNFKPCSTKCNWAINVVASPRCLNAGNRPSRVGILTGTPKSHLRDTPYPEPSMPSKALRVRSQRTLAPRARGDKLRGQRRRTRPGGWDKADLVSSPKGLVM